MGSTFVAHHTRNLFVIPDETFRQVSITTARGTPPTFAKESLRSLRLSKRPSETLSLEQCQDAIRRLLLLRQDHADASILGEDEEERALHEAILGQIVVGLYGQTMETLLNEAREAEEESEWWNDVERLGRNVVMYFIQSLPTRITRGLETIVSAVHVHRIPLRPTVFTPSSLRRLFPSSTLTPNALLVSLYPHLQSRPHEFTLSLPSSSPARARSLTQDPLGVVDYASHTFRHLMQSIYSFVIFPLELTRQECHSKRRRLEKLRDERAEALGTLAGLRDPLAEALKQPDMLPNFVNFMLQTLNSSVPTPKDEDLLTLVAHYAQTTLPTHMSSHKTDVIAALRRPSRLTLVWPRLLLFPPLALYAIHKLSSSRVAIQEIVAETRDTIVGLFRDWMFEPIKGVIATVRTGGEEGMLISKEGVKADVDSLERMSLALAAERLKYSSEQLNNLSRQVKLGDLTPILQVYEEDIKRPLQSAVTGTLLRSVFIQVQKAKVDIDQALAGIDKLLKSQELTFAFVGVAPAFAMVYLGLGYVRRVWVAGSGRGKYGGAKKRAQVWESIRRVERLLNTRPSAKTGSRVHPASENKEGTIPALTSGLLLLSVTRLRAYAETQLPARSKLRAGFLEDIEDLEDPSFTRTQKLRVIDRMWRCWSHVLGWERIVAERK